MSTPKKKEKSKESPPENSKIVKESATKKRFDRFSEPDVFVTLLVGPEPAKKFVVHKEFAVHHSPVFKAAFNSGFIEGQTQTYRLEDTSILAVKFLVQWIYFQALDIQEGEDVATITEVWEDIALAELEDMAMAELWVLGDKLLMPRLQNYTIRLIDQRQVSSHITATFTLHYIWDNTASQSPLRQFLIEQCRYDLNPQAFLDQDLVDNFPRDMLLELASLRRKREILDDDGNRIMSRFDVPEE